MHAVPNRKYRIGRSKSGLGLYATKPFRKREYIVTYRGRRLPNAEADRLEARGSRYMFEINTRWTIDGSKRWNVARYVNHSCRPNAEAIERRGPIIVYVRAPARSNPTKKSRSTTARITSRPSSARAAAAASNAWSGAPRPRPNGAPRSNARQRKRAEAAARTARRSEAKALAAAGQNSWPSLASTEYGPPPRARM